MSFSSSTVTIGHSTKKSDYDRLLANTQYLKAENVYEKKTFQSSTVFNATATFNDGVIFPALGKIGTLIIAASSSYNTSTEYLAGTTVLGNTLYYSTNTTIGTGGASLSQDPSSAFVDSDNWASFNFTGTWRLLSRVHKGTDSTRYPVGLFQRIA